MFPTGQARRCLQILQTAGQVPLTSLGTKLGGGIGTALAGWLLALSGYVGGAAVQSASCITMLHVMYLWLPMIFNLLITLILTRLNVEKANEDLRAKKRAG